MLREIPVSPKQSTMLKASGKRRHEVYSFYPIDKADCVCQDYINEWRQKMARMDEAGRDAELEKTRHIECPRVKQNTGYKRYKVVCNKCNRPQGYLYADSPKLNDWFDFHYVQWHYGKYWYGCFSPHISPITEKLHFECACGQDTRDFRANRSMPGPLAYEKELENRKGRDFGKADSKFRLEEISG